jgi:hypothetical protein
VIYSTASNQRGKQCDNAKYELPRNSEKIAIACSPSRVTLQINRRELLEVCDRCAGSVKVIAYIEDQNVIDRILAHLREKQQGRPTLSHLVPPSRAPPGSLPLFAGRESATTTLNQQPATTLLKNAWHGRLHAIAQKWMDMHCAITSANNFSGKSVVISRISPVQSAVSVRKPTLNRPFICPILPSSLFISAKLMFT